MTTDKPKWWQSWIVYVIVGLLVLVGPYVGGYFLLGEHRVLTSVLTSVNLPRPKTSHDHVREFKHDGLRIAFRPLGWAEAKLRDVDITVIGPDSHDFYKSDW